jgi:hypothetical protein
MEYVKHHVTASGNNSLRGFFSSDNVDFDPPSLSLRQNIMKAKAKYVYDLADGATGDAEEDTIRDVMAQSQNSYELIRLFGVIEGWAGLDDELPEGHLDPIARQLAQVLDQRDYVPYQLIRRYLILLDYQATPNLGDCFTRLLQWPAEFQPPEFDLLLSRKGDLLKTITSATMRNRVFMINSARIPPGVINQYLALTTHRVNELVALMYEVNYTTRICAALARLEYRPLFDVIADTVDPNLSNLQRFACRDTLQRLTLEFAAAEKAVEVVGSNEARTIVNRFMLTLKSALDNFPPAVPAPTVLGMIAAAINSVATTIGELRTAIINLPDAVAGIINLPNLMGTDDDDRARNAITQIDSQGALARASFDVKDKLVKALLNGSTDDDDELGIIRIMEAAKAYDQAELYQLAASATWESLYTSFNGDEYDNLENVLNNPV